MKVLRVCLLKQESEILRQASSAVSDQRRVKEEHILQVAELRKSQVRQSYVRNTMYRCMHTHKYH